MMISRTDRRRGHGIVAMALAGLLCSVPVKADTPHGVQAIEDEAIAAPDALALPEVRPEAELAPAEALDAGPDYEHLGDGEASYYGAELAGNRTASGERFDPRALTAAHRTLPMGSRLRVINKSNGKSVVVRINDRGPFVKKRIVDISRAAAEKIAMVRAGRAMVRLELLR